LDKADELKQSTAQLESTLMPGDLKSMQFMNAMISGQFAYMTYFILSATSFFNWIMPNYHKINKLFNFQSRMKVGGGFQTYLDTTTSPKKRNRNKRTKNECSVQALERTVLTRAAKAKEHLEAL